MGKQEKEMPKEIKMEMKPEKLSFWKRVWISIKDFEKYELFAIENLGKSIQYLLQIVALFTIIISACMTYKFSMTLQNGIEYFRNEIPNLTFENNTLSLETEKVIKIEESEEIPATIIIDTVSESEEEIQKQIDELNRYDNAALLLKDKIMIKNTMTKLVSSYNYEDIAKQYNVGNFNKQDVITFIENTNMPAFYASFFLVTFIYMFTVYLASIAIDGLMLAVLGFLTARIVGLKIKFSACYNMAIHALTLSILLNAIYIAVNTFTGFTIQYFQIMYTLISYIYMVTAILMIRSDLIKRKIEIGKLEEEQRKVKEELDRQEELERQKEEERKRQERREKQEEQDKKKKEKEKKEKKGPEVSPEGNA